MQISNITYKIEQISNVSIFRALIWLRVQDDQVDTLRVLAALILNA